MGLFSKILGQNQNNAIEVAAEKDVLYLPVEGEVIPLEAIGDGIFSEGVLGKGCGIRPSEETVYAPVNGTVTTVADTRHALGIVSDDGIEVLIHVGMDTVDMNGDGFSVLVAPNQKIKCGQPILKFNASKIKAAGHPTTTAFIVTNSDNFEEVAILQTGTMKKMSAVMKTA